MKEKLIAWVEKLDAWFKNLFRAVAAAFKWLVRHWGVALAVVVLLSTLAIILRALGFGWADWTGLGNRTEGQHSKTLWDWMELLLVPIALAAGALWLERSERASDRKIAEQRRKDDLEIAEARHKADLEIADNRNQETLLQAYLDKMDHLMLEKGLGMKVESPPPPEGGGILELPEEIIAVRYMAQIRTITVIRQLNTVRQNIVFQFLRDSGLGDFLLMTASIARINLNKTNLHALGLYKADLSGANLSGASLSGANLIEADLSEANLQRTYLSRAILTEAELISADLREANLREANLNRADLTEADLREANLCMADLSGAYLFRADLRGAYLTWTDLSGSDLTSAIISDEQLAFVKSLEGATMPDGSKYVAPIPAAPTSSE